MVGNLTTLFVFMVINESIASTFATNPQFLIKFGGSKNQNCPCIVALMQKGQKGTIACTLLRCQTATILANVFANRKICNHFKESHLRPPPLRFPSEKKSFQ